MDLEANKAVVRRIYEEGFNRGDVSVFDTLYATNFRHHSKTIHDVSSGAAGERESMLRFREAIPDVRFQIEDTIAEGDHVVVRLTVTGTPVKAFPPIQPGEPVEFCAVAVFRLDGGRVTEEWFYRDAAG
ncbi:MAG: ester cyclase [Deltaproteobacteria bacterium]|nr:ester cyclase [Deltaproteobacteria bacterium]MBW2361836.1 ester cyclase [Deltaproteobacteria bacterium]